MKENGNELLENIAYYLIKVSNVPSRDCKIDRLQIIFNYFFIAVFSTVSLFNQINSKCCFASCQREKRIKRSKLFPNLKKNKKRCNFFFLRFYLLDYFKLKNNLKIEVKLRIVRQLNKLWNIKRKCSFDNKREIIKWFLRNLELRCFSHTNINV